VIWRWRSASGRNDKGDFVWRKRENAPMRAM
jgi:hypothetical protein